MPNTTTIAVMASSMRDLLCESTSVVKDAPAQSKKYFELSKFELAAEDFRQRKCGSAATQLVFLFRNRALRFTSDAMWF
jgi:hypothetical protein